MGRLRYVIDRKCVVDKLVKESPLCFFILFGIPLLCHYSEAKESVSEIKNEAEVCAYYHLEKKWAYEISEMYLKNSCAEQNEWYKSRGYLACSPGYCIKAIYTHPPGQMPIEVSSQIGLIDKSIGVFVKIPFRNSSHDQTLFCAPIKGQRFYSIDNLDQAIMDARCEMYYSE